jgi:hypothetical protein
MKKVGKNDNDGDFEVDGIFSTTKDQEFAKFIREITVKTKKIQKCQY